MQKRIPHMEMLFSFRSPDNTDFIYDYEVCLKHANSHLSHDLSLRGTLMDIKHIDINVLDECINVMYQYQPRQPYGPLCPIYHVLLRMRSFSECPRLVLIDARLPDKRRCGAAT